MTHEEFASLTLTQCLEVAIVDMRKAILDERVIVHSTEWCTPLGDGECIVCDAGAVMLYSLNAMEMKPVGQEISPMHFKNDDVSARLLALDKLRCGLIYDAFQELMALTDHVLEVLHNADIPYTDEEDFWDEEDDISNSGYDSKEEMEKHIIFLETQVLPMLRKADEALAKAGISY